MKKCKSVSKKVFITFLAFSIVLGNFVPVFSFMGKRVSQAQVAEATPGIQTTEIKKQFSIVDVDYQVVEKKIQKIVEDILAQGSIYGVSVPIPQGLRLLDVQYDQGKITLNFSKELLIGEDFDEDIVRYIENRIITEFEKKEGITYRDISTLIEGTSTLEIRLKVKHRLDELLRLEKERQKTKQPQELKAGPLSGKKIALNPGHGYVYEYSYDGKWSFQRGEHWGILEDFVNSEIVMYLYPLLVNAGAEVFLVRDMDKNSGKGESELPKWQEGAKHYLKAIGAPGSVYDAGSTAKADDIWSRPYWANHNDADILIGIHNNGGGGTGTETWYDNTNGVQVESKKLADAIHGNILKRIQGEYNSSWKDRKVKADTKSKYGENFFAQMPSALVELAFMDTQSPDNNALHDENFKKLAAKAMYDGIVEYFGGYDLTIDASSLRMIDKGSGAYDVSLKVVNQGTKSIEKATICFQMTGENSCTELVSVKGPIASGSSTSVTILLQGVSLPEGNSLGEIRIVDVQPSESNTENNIIALARNHLESLSQNDPSGVDFSSIDLSGIQLNADTDSIDFILKGVVGSGGPEVDTIREEVRKTFMSSLVIPNWKQVVSLPMGSVDVQSPFDKTDLARVMLEADVAMKFDLFTPSTLNLEDLNNQWISLVKGSPYWNELSRKGFNVFPSWQTRGTIVPRETLVNVEDDKIFLNQATLGLDTYVEWVTIDLSAYGFSTAIADDINGRLAIWRELFTERLRSVAPTVEQKFLTDPKYQKLREVYPVVALAHWYKTLPRENLPYADLIDSENLTGLESEIPFDKAYWASQSKQHIGDFVFTDFYGGRGSGYVYGGVQLDIATPEGQGELTETQENILTNVLEDYTFLQEGNAYYLYGGNMQVPTPDLSGEITLPPSSFVMGRSLDIPVSIFNSGDVDASRFRIRLEGESIGEDGSKNQYLIAEREISGLNSWEEHLETITWTLPEIVGEMQFLLIIDFLEEVVESNEINNSAEAELQTVFNGPFANILSHEDGQLIQAYDVIFEGFGHDPEQGILPDGFLVWNSDRDGQLGVGGTITVPLLSPGAHIITLQATDQEGIVDKDTIQISVPEPGKPVVKITSPIEGQRLPSDTEVIFTADALDYEDGVLSGNSFLWNSDLDGLLGSGEWLSVNDLSIGNHTITLKATDLDGLFTEVVLHITIEQGPPVVLLSEPSDGEKFYQHENIKFFGSASDLQDGYLFSKMEWYSSRDGFIGTGFSVTKNLSVGEHTITLHVMDSDGQIAEKIVNVRVDYTPPVATFSSPKNGDEFPYFGSITFSGSASDTQDGALSGESLIWESSQTGFLGFGSPLTVSNLAPGYHTITLTAVDKDEAVDVKEITIFIDAGQPRVSITSPTDNQELFYHFPYTFSGSAIDERDGNLSGNQLIWLSNLDGEIGRGTSMSVSSLSVGEHVITLRATDSEGWLGEMSRTVTVASPHTPEVSLIKPRDGENIVHGDTLQLRASVRDYEDGTLTGNSVLWISNLNGEFARGDNVSFDSTSLFLGNHTITLRATDSLGATSEIITHFIITNRPPEAEILFPTESENIFVQDQNIAFSGRGSDLEDASNLSYTWSSNLNGTLGTGTSISIPASSLNVGTHTITFMARDNSGAESHTEVNIIIVKTGVGFINTFDNGSTEKVLDFTAGGAKEKLLLKIPSNASVEYAQVNFQGEQIFGINFSGGNYFLGTIYSTIAFADIDNDFDKDLFVGNVDGTLSFYRNDGNISIPLWHYVANPYSQYDVGWYARPYLVDIDGDFDYDLFLGEANGAGKIRFYENIGTRTEPEWNYVTDNFANVDMGGMGTHPVFVDIDGDFDYDLFASNYGTVYFYKNNNGSFEFITSQYADAYASSPAAPIFVDIDNDNDYDLFIGTGDGTLEFYKNIGNSTSPSWQLIDEKYMNIDIDTMASPLTDEGASPSFIDIDGDNDYDLFIGEGAGNINYFENKGNGQNPSFELKTEYYLFDVGNSSRPTLTDIDGDNDQDLFIGENYGYIRYFRNDGNQSSSVWTFVTNNYGNIDLGPYYNTSPSPTFADIDGDSDQDFFIGLSDGTIDFYRNIGDGYNATWQLAEENYKGIDVGNNPSHPYFVDIDTDGDFDLFTTNDGLIYFYENIGTKANAEWLSPLTYIFATGAQADPAFYDIDGDLDYDILVGNKDGTIISYLNNGNLSHPSFVQDNIYYGSIDVGYESSPYVMNIDGDSNGEIFIGNKDGGLSLYDATGSRNLSLDVGNDGDNEWLYSGEFITNETTVNFAQSINDYLEYFSSGVDTLVPLIIRSQGAGRLRVNNVNIQYSTTDSEPPVFGVSGFNMAAAASGVTTSGTNFITPNPVYVNQSITIRVSVSDNQGIASVVADVNGTQVILSAQGNNVYQATTQTPNQPGIYPVKITATDLGGIPASITEDLHVVVSGVELALSSADINLSSSSIDEGDTLNVVSRVYNFGDTSASFYMDLLGNGASIARSSLVTVSGNSYQDVSLNWVAQYGVTTLGVQADSTSVINEPDETNNFWSTPIIVRDITPPSLTDISYNNFVRVGDTVTLNLTATDNVTLSTITAIVNSQTYIFNYNSVTGKYETSFIISTGGEYEMEIRATDVNGLQTSHTELLTVYWSRPDFELKPDDILLSNSDPVEGEEIAITLTTNNVGLEAKTNIKVHFLVDGVLENEQYVNLAAPASWNLNFRWVATMGSHTLEFVMDPENQYEETVENNNRASVVLSVDTVQIPVILEVTLPEDIVEGEDFPVSVGLSETGFTGGVPTGDELVTVETDYGTTTLNFNSANKKFEGRLLYPELGNKKMNVKAQKPQSASYLEHRKVLVRSQYPDFELNEKEFFMAKVKPSHGEVVPMTLMIHNPGGKEINNVPVRMKVDGTTTDTVVVPVLGIGANVETDFNWNASLGDHTLVFEVDPDNTTFEFSEENNIITKSIRVVDIISPTIESITHEEAFIEGQAGAVKVVARDNLSIKRVIARLGGSESELIYDPVEDAYLGEIMGASGAETILEIVVEDEGGLFQSFQKYVPVYSIAADLIVERTGVSFDTATIAEGVPFEVVVQVENHGGTGTGTFSAYLEVDGILVDFENTSVAVGGSTEIRFNFIPTFGNHTMVIRLDAGGAVNESHEENNTLSIPFSSADITPPSTPLLTASPSVWSSENYFTVSWDPSSDAQGIREYLYQIDGGEWISIGVSTSVVLTDILEGSHAVNVVGRDRQGNLSEHGTALIFYDSQIPTSLILRELHLGGDWSTHTSPYFNWNIPVDNGSGVSSYIGVVDGDESLPIDLGSNIFYHPEFSSGIHRFKVKAKDATGKESPWSNEITVKIDVAFPFSPIVTSATHPDPDSPVDNNIPTFLITTPEDESGIIGYYYLFSPNSNEIPTKKSLFIKSQGDDTIFTIDRLYSALNPDGTPIPDGMWYFHVVTQDKVGNIGSEVSTTKITIDRNETPLLAYDPLPSSAVNNVSMNTSLAWSVGSSCNQTQVVDYEIYLYPRVETISRLTTLEDIPCNQTRVILETLPALLLGQMEYEWFIRAKDQNGNVVQSELWQFTTENQTPRIPLPVSPDVDIIRPRQFPNANKIDVPVRQLFRQ